MTLVPEYFAGKFAGIFLKTKPGLAEPCPFMSIRWIVDEAGILR